MTSQANNHLGARSQNALLHPVTLAAVGLLFTNDLVFKALWSSPWTTGKLSDLAWVVFACPLLAFLLSLITPGTRNTQRIVFFTAYVGLPLLYAAFNTFQSVHAAISTPLAMMSGRLAGSIPDPTDSLVIPLGLAFAVWVWHRPATTDKEGRQRQLALVVGAIAAFASVATSPADPLVGITAIGVAEDQTLVAGTPYPYFTSIDGGITWIFHEDYWEEDLSITWGGTNAKTPRGVYSIEDEGIALSKADNDKLVYPTSFLSEPGNVRYQRHATKDLGPRTVTLNAKGIVYHSPSDAVVAAFGIQGVLVGASNGDWYEIAVGPYAPTDFSAFARFLSVWDERGLWESVFGLCLASLAVALIFSHKNTPLGVLGRTTFSVVAITPAIVSMFLLFPDESNFLELPAPEAGIAAIVFGALGTLMFLPPRRLWPAVVAGLVLMLALCVLAFLVGAIQGFNMEAARAFVVLLVGAATALLYWYLSENWMKVRP